MKPLTITPALRARWKKINAKRKAEDKPPLNFPLWVKVRNRIAAVPESYHQGEWKAKSSEAPCGTKACLAGEAIICSERSPKAGLKLLWQKNKRSIPNMAIALLGLEPYNEVQIFSGYPLGDWVEPFGSEWADAKTSKAQARVAVRYLTHVIRTGEVID